MQNLGRTAASAGELNEILQKHSEIADKVVRPELSYYRDTHKTEVSYQPHLLKVSQNSQKVQEMNLPSSEETLKFYEKRTILLKCNIQKLKLIKSMLHSG